ncbi:LOW QUALITY PROTEIN: uncharacterized protein LOC114516423 [Dendronephthya gigantea]|uniref:LOW QUALITY PROTEIN: uncharacterized protein LOC114516423 n=1 Tax=Dendronephthya gigantea TaxID=151771 RepID=UPI00106C35CA|nr:LOW QUALITY PROTEIN: uncharacterized protein LOC114516423 [Dendronephthya gigantea]
MADQRNRPVPKQRSAHLGATGSGDFSTLDLYGSGQDVQRTPRIPPDFSSGQSGLPSCVQLKKINVSAEQKSKDGTLPQLLFFLDEACKKYSNDEDKSKLANLCIQAASSPNRKYRLLEYFQLLEDNKDDIDLLPAALSILEKYAVNLLREDKPPQWKVLKYNISIIQNMVLPVNGALNVLKKMGYTQETENALSFPPDVDEPNIQTILVLTADLCVARHETDALMKNNHPFLIFDKSGTACQGEALFNAGYCGVCSEQNLARNCEECDMQFCLQCDERWHCHKLRRDHIRTPLPPTRNKTIEEKRFRPVPVPRQRKGQKMEDQSLLQGVRNEGNNPAESYNYSVGWGSKHTPQRSPGNITSTSNMASPTMAPGNMMSPTMSPGNMMSPTMSPGNMMSPTMSPGNMTSSTMSPGNMMSPRMSPGNMMSPTMSPGNMMSPTMSPGNMTSPRMSPGNMMSPTMSSGNMTSSTMSPGNMTSPRMSSGNQGINLNPSQQRLSDKYGAFAPGNPHSVYNQGFNQPGSEPRDYNQSENMDQNEAKTLRRVLSCPNCSFLFHNEYEKRCPSCKVQLDTLLGDSEKQVLLKDLAKSSELATRTLPDPPRAPGLATRVNEANEEMYEDIDEMLEWVCEHCTCRNPLSTKVCQVCCKTPADLKKFPNLVEKSTPPQSKPAPPSYPPAKQMTPPAAYGSQTNPGRQQDHRAVYMTPKDHPLDGGVFVSRNDSNAPPLPAKKQPSDDSAPGGRVRDAQKNREQEISEKKKAAAFDEEKQEFHRQGLISEKETLTIDSQDQLHRIVEERKRSGYYGQAEYPRTSAADDLNDEQLRQLMQSGVLTEQDLINNGLVNKTKVVPSNSRDTMTRQNQFSNPLYENPRANERFYEHENDLSLSEDQLQKLLREGGFLEESHHPGIYQDPTKIVIQGTIHLSSSIKLVLEARSLMKNEIFWLKQVYHHPPRNKYTMFQGMNPPVIILMIFQMMAEFHLLSDQGTKGQNYDRFKNKTFQNYNVIRDAPVVHGLYDKRSSKGMYSMPVKSGSKDNFSSYLNSQTPLETISSRNIDEQSKLYVEWIKEAEKHGFTPEELNLANHLNWQDPKKRNPVQWLKDEWSDRVAEVIGKVTERTSNENDCIGNLSTDEAKQALLENHGSVESACKSCIESRREKLAKMGQTSFFTRVDCLNALDRNDGNLEKALLELENQALEPIRQRVLRLQDLGRRNSRLSEACEKIIRNKNVSFERRVRIVYTEKNMKSWGRAETAVRLVDFGDYDVEDCIEAAEASGDMERSLAYLQQDCPICVEQKPMGQMITFLNCQDKICKDCVTEYLKGLIKEKQIHQITCPVCSLPDLSDEATAADYFNNLDIMIRQLVDPETHDIFQKKLRDRALRKEENFRWCAHCSYGFINELPNVNKMQCPNCQQYTCFTCKKQWEDQHEGITCQEFARWKEENDEEYQMAGLAGHLARNGIDCPGCKFRYDLARGGCMHFKCNQCGHEFCSGCYNPFKRERCTVIPNCTVKGMHAHHPRSCLFYLRDWEIQTLQELLQENGVDYKAEARRLNVQDGDENAGAVEAAQICNVMLQLETGEDHPCERLCQPDHDGLCEKHYKEYLVDLINKNGVDPVDKMDARELEAIFRRAGVVVEAQQQGEADENYQQRLLQGIKQRIPLPGAPVLPYPAPEAQGGDDEE